MLHMYNIIYIISNLSIFVFDKCKAKFSKSIGCYDYITSLCIPPTAQDTLKKNQTGFCCWSH